MLYVNARPISPGIADWANGIYLQQFRHLKIVYLIATKYEPFMFPMLGFVFAHVSNIYIIVILYDFCLLPAYLGYVIVNVWNLELQT
jgi:hypothetical protein